MSAELGLAALFEEALENVRAAQDYADIVKHLGLAAQAVLDFHGRQRRELPVTVARSLYLIGAAAQEAADERHAALTAQYVEAVDALRHLLRFATDADGTFHVMFHDARTHPLDVVRDLSYCGIRDEASFTGFHTALPPSTGQQPLCPECAVKSITQLYGPKVVVSGTDRAGFPVPPATAEELAENESEAVTESRCPGPPHPGHASSDWTCSYDRTWPSEKEV